MNELDLHLRVLEKISQHTQAHTITAAALAEMFGLRTRDGRPDERKIKTITQRLVETGHKIGSSKVEPKGFFLARTPEEIYDTAERLRQEGRKYFAKANKLADFGSQEPTIWEQPSEAA